MIMLYGKGISTRVKRTGKVRPFPFSPNLAGKNIVPDGLTLLPPNPIRGRSSFSKCSGPYCRSCRAAGVHQDPADIHETQLDGKYNGVRVGM